MATSGVAWSVLLVVSVCGVVCSARCHLEYDVTEEQPVDSFVADLAHDCNITDRAVASFQLRSTASTQHSRRYFVVDRAGLVKTARQLDRELICGSEGGACQLNLDVSVRLVGGGHETVRVVIEVVDINDNAPVFPQPQVTLTVSESSEVGSVFLIPAAFDADSKPFAVTEYQLIRSSSTAADTSQTLPFQLQVSELADGSMDVHLRLTSPLDRETVSSYELIVVAVDGGSPALSAQLSVNIIVSDANDHSPVFETEHYHVTVSEDLPPGSSLLTVHAVDRDYGANGAIIYSMPDHVSRVVGSMFRLEPDSGVLYLRTALDFEKTAVYHLTVTATDQATTTPLSATAKVTVSVLDVNDNRPTIIVNILTSSGVAEVRENSDLSGTFVAHIASRDLDFGNNGRVECQLDVDGSRFFQLVPLFDSTGGSGAAEYKMVTAITFDRELRSDYHVVLTCWDSALHSRLESSREITVSVLDENDNAPRILQNASQLVMRVAENSPVGVLLMQVNASDADDGINAQLTYELRPLHDTATVRDVISIDHRTGRITTTTTFDYDTQPHQYQYLLTISDEGSPVHSSSATVTLLITDTNDNAPQFERSAYYFSVAENQPVGTVIGRLAATDKDVTAAFSRVLYDVTGPTGMDCLEVDRKSGEVRTVRRLDREHTAVYVFTVTASNDVTVTSEEVVMTSTADVTVYVDDINDNRPVFVFPGLLRGKTVDIVSPHALAVGSLVVRLEATDSDTGPAADIEFGIASGNDDNAFEIDAASGIITVGVGLRGRLERSMRVHRLIVVAKDQGIPSLQTLADLTVCVNETALEWAGSGEDVGRAATVVVAGGAAIGGALAMLCLLLAAILLCLLRRRRRHQQALKLQTARENSSLCGSASCYQHRCSSVVPTTQTGSVVGYSREPGPGDDGSYCAHHHHHHHHQRSRSSLQSSCSSCSDAVREDMCRCESALSDAQPTLSGDVDMCRPVLSGDVNTLQCRPTPPADPAPVECSVYARSTVDSGLVDSVETDQHMDGAVVGDVSINGVAEAAGRLLDNGARHCSRCQSAGKLLDSSRTCSSCSNNTPAGRRPHQRRHHHHHHRCRCRQQQQQQQHCLAGMTSCNHHHRQLAGVHRCNSWLPTIIPGQDPMMTSCCSDSVTCESDSQCSCPASCADSGRGASEHLPAAAVTSSTTLQSKPLISSLSSGNKTHSQCLQTPLSC